MDFTKFVAMLDNRGLFFARASKLDDPFEGSYSRANEQLRPQVYTQAGLTPEQQKSLFGQLKVFSQQTKFWVLVNCWHMNEVESAAMWKLYTASNESVCIQSTYRRLREVLSEDRFAVSVVRYIDYESEWLPEGNLMYPYVHKRRSFAHERELRALHFDPPPATLQGEGTIDFAHEPSNAGKWQSVELSKLVEKIYVAPAAPVWFRDLVKSVVRRYQLDVPVQQSDLDATPFF